MNLLNLHRRACDLFEQLLCIRIRRVTIDKSYGRLLTMILIVAFLLLIIGSQLGMIYQWGQENHLWGDCTSHCHIMGG